MINMIPISPEQMQRDLEFLLELMPARDTCRSINKSATMKRIKRGTHETVMEHQGFLVIMVMVLDKYISKRVDRWELVQALSVHDLPEIHTGDTWYRSPDLKSKQLEERKVAQEMFSERPKMHALWLSVETGMDELSETARKLDYIQPVLSQLYNEGLDWKINGVTYAAEYHKRIRHFNSEHPLDIFARFVYDIAKERKLFASEI